MLTLFGHGARAAVLVGLVAGLAGLAGCGGGTDGPGVARAGGARATAAAATPSAGSALRFAQCMREHGVAMEDPGPDGRITLRGDPSNQGVIEAAQKACRQFEPNGGEGGAPEMSSADQAKFLRFARCMREHGVEMEDPDFEGGGVRMRLRAPEGGASAPGRAEEQEAQRACASMLPAGVDGPGGPA
jgi:hypothetical protein